MGLNLQDIHARFNAGISTVAIDSPTGAEMSVVNHIAIEFLINLPSPRRMRVLLWDTARQLQTVTCPNSSDYTLTPDGAAGTSGAPVDLLKYISPFVLEMCHPPTSDRSSSSKISTLTSPVLLQVPRSSVGSRKSVTP